MSVNHISRWAQSSLLIAAIVGAGLGCGHGKIDAGGANYVVKGGSALEVRAEWIKDKGDKWDGEFFFRNTHSSGIILLLTDISCGRGAVTGQVKHSFFNTGERTIDLRPGEMKRFVLVCRMGVDVEEGEFFLNIKRVSEDTDGQGKVRGKVLIENVRWAIKERS